MSDDVQVEKDSATADSRIEKDKKNSLSGSKQNLILAGVFAIAFAVLYYLMIKPAFDSSAVQQETGKISAPSFPLTKVFAVLFLMLGPFKIIGPFANITRGADAKLVRKIALLAIAFSCLALLFASFLGGIVLRRFGIPVPILALSAGLVLLLVALTNIVQQFKPATLPEIKGDAPILSGAGSFAFPTIVTPYGIGALVVFLVLANGNEERIAIGAIVLGILLLNLISMLITPYVFRILGIFLQIVAAVLAVIQVALGVQIIYNSIRAILK
jgi:multiple antibiotic resistance protein